MFAYTYIEIYRLKDDEIMQRIHCMGINRDDILQADKLINDTISQKKFYTQITDSTYMLPLVNHKEFGQNYIPFVNQKRTTRRSKKAKE